MVIYNKLCHRVVVRNGNFTGDSGGMNNKISLLKLERIHINEEKLKIEGISIN